MSTFSAYLYKEIIESTRQFRYIILAVGIILFAILDPVMLKIMPAILKEQMQVDISSFMILSQRVAIQNYVKDLFQVGNIFVVFSLAGTINDELINRKFIFPFSKGANKRDIVLSKFLHYTLVIALLTVAGFFINYIYANFLFEGDHVAISELLLSIVSMIIFFVFNISLVFLCSSIFRKTISAGLAALVINYLIFALSQVKALQIFLPYNLINISNFSVQEDIILSFGINLILSAILIYIVIKRLKSSEII